MPVGLSTRGARDFYAVAKHLKTAGDGAVRKEFLKAVRGPAKPLPAKVKQSARDRGPKEGGLNEELAKKPVRVQTRTGAKTAGVRVVGTKVDPRINGLGRIQHPVFGRKPPVVQYVPALKGYFDDPLMAAAPAIQTEVVRAMDDFVRDLLRKGRLVANLSLVFDLIGRDVSAPRRSRTSGTPRSGPARRARSPAGSSPRG
jgi:hypothetical protein